MFDGSMNYLAVIVVSVVLYALGALWYSPVLFSKMFIAAIGKTQEELMEGFNPLRTFGLEFLNRLFAVYVLARIIGVIGATTIGGGMAAGFMIWFGFVAATNMATVLFEGRSTRLYILNVAYHLVGLVIAGAVLAVWQ